MGWSLKQGFRRVDLAKVIKVFRRLLIIKNFRAPPTTLNCLSISPLKLTYNGNEVPDRYVDDRLRQLLRPSTGPTACYTVNDGHGRTATTRDRCETGVDSSRLWVLKMLGGLKQVSYGL